MIKSAHLAGVIEKAVETAAALSLRAANHEVDEALFQSSLNELQHTIDELKIAQSELNEAQQSLNASHMRFRKLEETAPVAIIGVDFHLNIVQWNAAAEKAFGWPAFAVKGQNFITQCIRDEDRARVRDELIAALDGAAAHFEAMIRTRDNQLRVMQWCAALLPPDEQQRDELSICGQDITERQEAARQRLIVSEIQHRVKNNLATVLAIAEQSIAKSSSLEQFRQSFRGRIIALAHMHSLLAERGAQGVPFSLLVTQSLRPYLAPTGPHADLDIEPMSLTAKAGQSLSIVLHELTTNATKYGSLQSATGLVRVHARVDARVEPPMLRIAWIESGGPAVALPQHKGLGTELIEQIIRFELRGESAIHFDVSGLHCEITIPWSATVGSLESGPPEEHEFIRAADGAGFAALQGRKILLVEDTALVAEEMHHMLLKLGCVVVGPAATFEEASDLVRTQRFDAVLLDVDLGGQEVWPIADDLLDLATPFILTTGFACPSSLPREFQGSPYLEKPFEQRELGEKLVEVLTGKATNA